MLDTVLNLGLNDASVEGLAAATGNERFAWDSYRRFVQMFGNVVRGVAGRAVRGGDRARPSATRGVELRHRARRRRPARADRALPARSTTSRRTRASSCGWRSARCSTRGGRARVARTGASTAIPDDWGTAVNVQQMVFGNKGATSGSGVAFSRDEVTGAPEPSATSWSTPRARTSSPACATPRDIAELADVMPEAHAELMEILRTLEAHYGDMQDTEFTVEEGRLYLLQTRNAKRPAQAAVRFACDAVDEGLLTREQALATIDAGALEALLHPTFDPAPSYECSRAASRASPGAAKGEVVFTAHDAVAAAGEGRDVILVRPFTEADDVAGFHAARGHPDLRGRQGLARRARRARDGPAGGGRRRRARDRPDAARDRASAARSLREGDRIAIDGTPASSRSTTCRWSSREVDERFERVLGWADELRRLGVRANADTPEDARARARARRRGHRPVPHRAHVHGRRPPAEDARDDHGRRRARSAARRSTSCCRCSRPTSRGCSRRWRACRSRSACSTRRCTSSCPTSPSCVRAIERARLDRVRRARRARADARARRGDPGDQPDARHARLPARDRLSRDLRDAGARDHARRARGARAQRRRAAPGDHDPARRLRARARDHARARGADRRRRGHARRGATTRSGR